MTVQMQLLLFGVVLAVLGVAMIFVFMPWRRARLERADQRRGILNASSPGKIGLVGLSFLILSLVILTVAGAVR